jgi:hypothetical protein
MDNPEKLATLVTQDTRRRHLQYADSEGLHYLTISTTKQGRYLKEWCSLLWPVFHSLLHCYWCEYKLLCNVMWKIGIIDSGYLILWLINLAIYYLVLSKFSFFEIQPTCFLCFVRMEPISGYIQIDGMLCS